MKFHLGRDGINQSAQTSRILHLIVLEKPALLHFTARQPEIIFKHKQSGKKNGEVKRWQKRREIIP
jgi:hypothetical protein